MKQGPEVIEHTITPPEALAVFVLLAESRGIDTSDLLAETGQTMKAVITQAPTPSKRIRSSVDYTAILRKIREEPPSPESDVI